MANSDCKQILNLIPLYIDNMLSDEEIDIVSRHLDSCKNCKCEFEFMKTIMGATKEISDVEIPKDFHKNLMQKAERLARQKRARRYLMLRRIGAGVAAAAVVALSVVTFGDFIKPQDSKILDKHLTPNLSDKPFYLTAPSEENVLPKAIDERRTDIQNDATPQAEKSESKTDSDDISKNESQTKETQIPASLSINAQVPTYVLATVTLTDDVRDQVLEILSDYEKDDIGYIVPDMSEVIDDLENVGAIVSFKNDDTIKQNHIVIE